MARWQHVVGKCSFCVTMTRALAKYHVSKECSRQSVIASQDGDWRSILTNEHVVSGKQSNSVAPKVVESLVTRSALFLRQGQRESEPLQKEHPEQMWRDFEFRSCGSKR